MNRNKEKRLHMHFNSMENHFTCSIPITDLKNINLTVSKQIFFS